jgi:hypothetical protein
MCKILKVVPCRYFVAHIDNQRLTMKYRQFSQDEIKAVCRPLEVSSHEILRIAISNKNLLTNLFD